MKEMKYCRRDVDEYYAEDVYELQKILHKAGYVVASKDVRDAWDHVSSDQCAGWLIPSTYGMEDQLKMLLVHLVEI